MKRLRAERLQGEMKMASENSGFSWFLVGLGAGALLGVLYAPKPGRETRDDLASSAREGSEYVKQRASEAANQVSGLVDRSKDQLSEYVDRGKEVVDRGRSQIDQYVDRGKQVVSQQGDKVAAAVDAGKRAYRSSTGDNPASGVGDAASAGGEAYRTT
jgi:gas vesicle protein